MKSSPRPMPRDAARRSIQLLALAVAALAVVSLPAMGHPTPGSAVAAHPSHAAASAAALSAARSSLAAGAGPAARPGPAEARTAVSSAIGYGSALGTPWTQVQDTNQPSARATPTMVYDPIDGYVVYFGGGWDLGSSGNDTWTFVAGNWTNITASVSGSPLPREDAAMAWDAVDQYVVLFGGYSSITVANLSGNGSSGAVPVTLNDTWSYVGGTWTNRTGSVAPSPRFDPAMTYDYTDGYVLLFGGASSTGVSLADTWTYRGGTWTDITGTAGTGPSGRDFTTLTDDPSDGYAVLFGGWDPSNGTILGDTWTFAGGTWTSLSPAVAPSPLRGAMAAYDSATRSVVLFGGAASAWYGPWGVQTATWSFSGGAWTNLGYSIASSPSARFAGALTNTSVTGTLLLADGCLGQGCPSYLDLSDAWLYNASGPYGRPWVEVSGAPSPSARATPAMAYDPVDGYVVYFGGGWDVGASVNDTWIFQNLTWTNISSTLTVAPSAREDPMMAWDAADQYMVLFGGYTSGGAYGAYLLSDTWKFVGGTWTNISSYSAATPPGRFAGAMAYAYHDAEIVLTGGDRLVNDVDLGPMSDTWTFRAGNWTDVTSSAGSIPARDWAAFADDPADGYAVLYGGWDSSRFVLFNDTWIFSNGSWTQLNPSVNPGFLRAPMLTYEPVGQYLLLFGGVTYSSPGWPFGLESQTWSFQHGSWTNLTGSITTEPPARFAGGMTNISTSGTLVMADGSLGQGSIQNEVMHDTWLFNWSHVNGTVNLSHAPVGPGDPTSILVHAIGGDGRYAYSFAGLPPGCASADTNALLCNATAPGTFQVVVDVTDGAGASSRLPVNLTVPGSVPLVVLTASSSAGALDVGQTVVLSALASGGGGGPYTYSYLGLPPGCVSANTSSLSCAPSRAGSYSIAVTASEPFYGSATSVVGLLVHPALVAVLSGSALAIDLGQSATLQTTALGGTGGPYSYHYWALPAGCTSSDVAALSCAPALAGTFAITVTVQDSVGGAAVGSLNLVVHPPVSIAAVGTASAIDLGESVEWTAVASNGSGVYSYAWTALSAGCSASARSAACTPTSAGTWMVSVVATDTLGQSSPAAVLNVLVNPDPALRVLGGPASGDGGTLVATAYPTGGTGAMTVSWDFGDGFTGTGLSAHHTFSSPGTYTVRIWYNDSRGFSASTSLSFVAHPSGGPVTSPPAGGLGDPLGAIGGAFGLGIAIGLLGLVVVAAWLDRRRRELAEGAALVSELEATGPSAAPPRTRSPP